MKTQKTTAKHDTMTAAIERAQETLSRFDMVKREMEKVDTILYYNEPCAIGIAYRKDTGSLVEFQIPTKSYSTDTEEMTVTEITLAESLEWVEKMQFAELRLDTCLQFGVAFAQWMRDLKAALAPAPATAN